ncbi:hypothetical protein ACOMHN_002512 [Nucella lapillus]
MTSPQLCHHNRHPHSSVITTDIPTAQSSQQTSPQLSHRPHDIPTALSSQQTSPQLSHHNRHPHSSVIVHRHPHSPVITTDILTALSSSPDISTAQHHNRHPHSSVITTYIPTAQSSSTDIPTAQSSSIDKLSIAEADDGSTQYSWSRQPHGSGQAGVGGLCRQGKAALLSPSCPHTASLAPFSGSTCSALWLMCQNTNSFHHLTLAHSKHNAITFTSKCIDVPCMNNLFSNTVPEPVPKTPVP